MVEDFLMTINVRTKGAEGEKQHQRGSGGAD